MTAKRSSPGNSHLCQFPFADGRKCRMLRLQDHPTLCLFHARQEDQLLEAERLGAELSASLTGNFLTATDINFVLGKLFTALAQNRIAPRNAATLAYIGQLLLHSLRNVKEEYKFHYKFDSWEKMLNQAIPLSNSSPVIDDPMDQDTLNSAHTSDQSSADPSDQSSAGTSEDSSPSTPVASEVS
jgi:hypothetical protein